MDWMQIERVRLVERGGYLGVMEQDKSILGEKKKHKSNQGAPWIWLNNQLKQSF